jgi:hypothetical protein
LTDFRLPKLYKMVTIIDFKLECDYIYSDDLDKYFIAEKGDTCVIVTNSLEQVTDFEYSWADASRKCKAMNNGFEVV